MELKRGLLKFMRYAVTEEMTASRMASGALDVYATPMMIANMEHTCMLLAAECLMGDDTTVGTMVNIHHLAASPVGATVTIEAELIEIDGRRLLFSVMAKDGEELIGEGTHERFIVDSKRFMRRVEEKKARLR